jgi:hypothetical protein
MESTDRIGLSEALEQIESGEWQKAHAIVQQHETPQACWLHGIVHLMEGDLENARYWYSRAERPFSDNLPGEIAAPRAALRQQR